MGSFIDNRPMTDAPVTLPILYIRQFIELVDSRGVPTAGWLQQLGIDPNAAGEQLITLPWASLRSLLLDAGRLIREPSIGLLVGERLHINAHGVLGHAAMSARTVRDLLGLIERFLVLRTDLVHMSTVDSGNTLDVILQDNRPLGDIRQPVTEVVAMAIHNILDIITLGQCKLTTVTFPFDGDQALAEALFRCPVHYNRSQVCLSLPLATIDKPLKMANGRSFEEATRICQQELRKIAAERGLTSRVRRLLLQSQNGFPSLDITARRFHLTPRTLHRRLLAEGTAYRPLLEEVRQQLAMRYLETGKMTVKEIAFALGYSDTANFRKAFKRWTNQAPSDYATRAHTDN